MLIRISVVVALVLGLAGCDLASKPSTVEAQEKATWQLQVEQEKWRFEISKVDQQLRYQVAKTCVDHGFVPVITNGNVDCKKVQ